MEAHHGQNNDEYQTYLGIETGTKDQIHYAVGDDALAPLKKGFIEFGDETPQTIIINLHKKVCIKLTASKKDNFKSMGYQKPLDITQNISTYYKYLDDLQDRIDTRVISTTKSEKIMAATARMYQIGYFTQSRLINWENKAEANNTWVNLKTYFTNLYQSQEQSAKATAKTSMYRKETNQLRIGSNAQTVGSTISNDDKTATMMAAL